MAQANRQTTKHLTDLASRFCSSFVYIGELFADILRGGKSYSYKVSSTISPEEVLELHSLCFSENFEMAGLQATSTFSLFSEKNLIFEKQFSGLRREFIAKKLREGDLIGTQKTLDYD